MKILFSRGNNMISLNNINKSYNSGTQKFHALKDINIAFPEKGMVFIVGKSGSGKSTLLNIIGGIDSYDSGDLLIDGLSTKDFSRSDFNSYRNSYIGFIFQEFNVIKNLNVFENIALSLQLKNEKIKKNYDLITNTIAMVGLKGKEKRKMNQLSGGERQRVAIARALVKNPKIIIADEPTGNLDKKNRDIVMDILKKLSNEHLVLVVTHDKTLSRTYGNFEITLKDGQIINNTLENQNKVENDVATTNIDLKPIQPSFRTSVILSCKSLKQNLFRFIIIIILFCISLIFANTTINLYFSNATAQYTNFQTEYNNKYISLSQQQTLYNQTVKTGFFQIDTTNYENLIYSFNRENDSSNPNVNYQYKIYKTFKNPIDIDWNLTDSLDPLYSKTIDNIIVIEDFADFSQDYNIIRIYNTLPTYLTPIRCYITDYVAYSLLANNYFNVPIDKNESWDKYFVNKTIKPENLNNEIYIEGIIETNFKDFMNADLDDPNIFASFTDNKVFYNSLFFESGVYVYTENLNQYVSTNNIKYTYDDFIYSALNQNGIYDNVKLTSYDETNEVILGKEPEKKIDENDFEQIAISTGLLKEIFGLSLEDLGENPFGDASMDYALLNPETASPATFNFYGYRRVTTNFSCQVVGIIESDEPTIYFCNPQETNMYFNYLRTSFSDYNNSSKNFGGTLTVLISDNQEDNISLYQSLRENNITIDNLSYIKLQVVNQFINDNLILFLALFFALCVFSVLMIFNFIVVTIKNSTKDIGIYMSLGMNGLRISFIYLFQILVVSTISFIISLIGAIIFLNLLDTNLSAEASNLINQYYNLNILPIDFQTFKVTSTGITISLLIAYIVPTLSVIIPLINLSRKRPIDVLKVS